VTDPEKDALIEKIVSALMDEVAEGMRRAGIDRATFVKVMTAIAWPGSGGAQLERMWALAPKEPTS
jgi:hypothetical protein